MCESEYSGFIDDRDCQGFVTGPGHGRCKDCRVKIIKALSRFVLNDNLSFRKITYGNRQCAQRPERRPSN